MPPKLEFDEMGFYTKYCLFPSLSLNQNNNWKSKLIPSSSPQHPCQPNTYIVPHPDQPIPTISDISHNYAP